LGGDNVVPEPGTLALAASYLWGCWQPAALLTRVVFESFRDRLSAPLEDSA